MYARACITRVKQSYSCCPQCTSRTWFEIDGEVLLYNSPGEKSAVGMGVWWQGQAGVGTSVLQAGWTHSRARAASISRRACKHAGNSSQKIKFHLISTLLICVHSCYLHKNGKKRNWDPVMMLSTWSNRNTSGLSSYTQKPQQRRKLLCSLVTTEEKKALLFLLFSVFEFKNLGHLRLAKIFGNTLGWIINGNNDTHYFTIKVLIMSVSNDISDLAVNKVWHQRCSQQDEIFKFWSEIWPLPWQWPHHLLLA